MKLVIVESPSKAKTIQKYLGGDFRVLASGGHVCDLPEKTLGVDVDNGFEPHYEVNPTKKATIKRMKDELKKAEKVYLATDPDREGEAISWHLQQVLEIPDGENRIEFNEISKNAVNSALKKPRKININLVDAQQARRVLDRLVGYKISPVLGRKIRGKLSAGRVQSVALRMIVDREREIQAFVPEEYWTLCATLSKEGTKTQFKAMFTDFCGKKMRMKNRREMDRLLSALQGKEWSVDTVKRGVSKSHPQPPFTTSTLTQDASHKLNLTAPQVMQIAQQLYEGVEIEGEGQVALVTYIRTDSVRISTEAMAAARAFIERKYGKEYLPEKPNFYKSKSEAQDAHEAIRPISLERTPESIKGKVQNNQYRVYKLIYERFLASQSAEAIYNTLQVRVSAHGNEQDFGFKLTGKAQAFAGYTAVYAHEEVVNEEEGESKLLPNLLEGDKLTLHGLKEEQKFTKPASRYTDASLVKAMEENGIGRPSTYASIINVLLKREYVEKKDKKNMSPTELGFAVVDMMMKYFGDIMDLGFTAEMETKLDKIEEGGTRWKDLIATFYPPFIQKVNAAYRDGAKMKVEPVQTDVICDKCGAKMVIREGRYGKFLACPNYPNCKNIKSMAEEVATCPHCGKAVTKRKSKAGKTFYGCSGYPTCNFMSWDLPAPKLCPKCANTMTQQKGKDGLRYVCTDKKCGHVEIVSDSSEE